MFNKTLKKKQDGLESWLTRLDDEIHRLNMLLDQLQVGQGYLKANVRAMDYELEIHELDIEYLKANTKTKKKGNK